MDLRNDNTSEIPTATTTFSIMPDSMVTLITSSEVCRLPNFKMVDNGPEVPILAVILNFRLKSVSEKVGLCTSEKYVPENAGVTAGILLLSAMSEVITTSGLMSAFLNL